ncbi:MAG: sugar ABC transporter ATP-binding protein [Deltaproteobacteria bacterium]|nr:sugar ABC transporter ATP-binding protein [Deltaproteobacteria bacterium]
MNESVVLSVRNIVKKYPGVIALDRVCLDFFKGEIHAICGENGAGKTTFIKILTGAIKPDEGIIEIEGIPHSAFSPHEAMFRFGIAAIYQEFNLIPYLSVAENIFIGNEKLRNRFLDIKAMNQKAGEILSSLGIDIDPRTPVESLGVAYKQIIEIAKAISHNVKILIMDEPTAPLTTNEVDKLYELISILKKQGVSIVYISHRLSELFDLSDRVSVFRDGKYIRTMETKKTNKQELISLMVGRELYETYSKRTIKSSTPLLEITQLSTPSLLKNISFTLYKGEVLGLGGLVGAGRTELIRAIFGADSISSGNIKIEGKSVSIKHPRKAIRLGLGLIPEDRKQHGVISELSVKENILYSSFTQVSLYGFIIAKQLSIVADKFKKRLRIATPNLEKKVKELSGGNQQKVILARCLATNSEIILFDEPTRGIDVGAKQEIYELINELVAEGKGVLLISSDMPELLGMSDRIIVMHEGHITGTLTKEEATQEQILKLASGE